MNLKDYTLLLKVLEVEIKLADPMAASNVARELSAIYLKTTYGGPQKGTAERLGSLVNYIKKTVPDYSEVISELIEDVIEKTKNRA